MSHQSRARGLTVLLLVAFTLFAGVRAAAESLHVSPIRGASAILIEPTTGQVLHEQNPDLPRSPASIAKLMLELIVVERLQSGELRLDEPVRVSGTASRIGGSQAYLAQDEVFMLEDLMKAIVIASANDACAAIAEHIAGSCDGFVDLMNLRARQLGLENTYYRNVHGLDDEPGAGNLTTARDISTIARRLVALPHVLEWSQISEAPFRNGTFILRNTNKLLGRFPGMDGLKTGYTRKAGWCLCATAERNGLRLVSVVMGADSEKLRFAESARLLGSGFAQLRREVIAEAGTPFGAPVRVSGGHPESVQARPAETLAVVLTRGVQAPDVKLIPRAALRAPLAAGDTVGVYEVVTGTGEPVRVAAVAAVAVKRASIFQRFAGMLRPKRD